MYMYITLHLPPISVNTHCDVLCTQKFNFKQARHDKNDVYQG